VACYWAVQALVFHAGIVFFFAREHGLNFRDFTDTVSDAGLLLLDGIVITLITAAQAVLLIPVRRPRMGVHSPGLRFVHSAVGGFAIAGALWLALWPITIILESVGVDLNTSLTLGHPFGWIVPLTVWALATALLWLPGRDGLPVQLSVVICSLGAAVLFAGLVGALGAIPRLVRGNEDLNRIALACMCGAVLLGWIVATPLVYAFVRRRGAEDGVSRLASRLFLGTLVETAAIIPLEVMVRRKSSCYCEETTFWALATCWGLGLLVCGPVIFLVPLSRRRKRWYAGRCDACGYDMSGCMTADRCPECGAGWKPADPTSGC